MFELPTSSDLGAVPPLYWLLAIVPALLLARRVRVLRTIFSVASWLLLGGLLFLALQQQQRFNPSLARILGKLDIGRQQVSGGMVRITMSPDGHFWANVTINGIERRMLVDSGATVTAISAATAEAAGLQVNRDLLPLFMKTANGVIPARSATVDTLRLGTITARDFPVVVSPALGNTDILGMNFLSRIKSWRVEDGALILEPHRPQLVS